MPAIEPVTEVSPGVFRIHFFGKNYLAAFSGRQFPNDKHTELLNALGIKEEHLCRVKQVHGNRVIAASEAGLLPARVEADGLFTNQAAIALGIMTADCVPVFFVDPVCRVIGLAHAGWRGIYAGIVQEMIKALEKRFSTRPENLQVIFGPSIRKCCYEVGPEFRDYFPGYYYEGSVPSGRRRCVDLTGAISALLFTQGILPEHLCDTQICTSCQNNRFFSVRKDRGSPERILSILQISSF